MSKIEHHLSDDLLMAYSAGSLPEAFSLIVATHISMCDDCRARMHEFDAVGGAVLEDNECEALADDAFAATMKLINAAPQKQIRTKRPTGGVFPAPLQDYVGGDLSAVKWKRIGNGVRQAILQTSREATARLLHIPAGCEVPDHGHNGTELTLVLQGAFLDDGQRFARGDLEIANEDLEHTPIADIGEDCICLAATDAPLRFNSLMPRLAQPFLRI